MSDTAEEIEEQQPDLKALRKKAEERDELAKANAELNKRLVFADAGVDRNTPLGKLLFATYEGTDPEDLKSKATEVGYSFETKLPEPEKTDGPAESDVRAQLAGGTPPGAIEADVLEEMHKRHLAAKRDGMPADNARFGLINDIIAAGVKGDPRFRFDDERWMAEAVQACAGEPMAT